MSSVRAQRIIDRIHAVALGYEDPDFDRAAAECAIHRHFTLCSLDMPPLRWVHDPRAGYQAALRAVLDADAWIGPWTRVWREARRQAWEARARVPWSVPMRRAEIAPRKGAALADWQGIRSALVRDPDPVGSAEMSWALRQASCDVVMVAADAASWSAESEIVPAIERWITLLQPLVQAFEAGLWLFWATRNEIVVLPRPAVRTRAGQLHCEDGSAARWREGSAYYFWKGVEVPEKVVLRPRDILATEITNQRNAEVRRVMLERFGAARYIQDVGGSLLHSDDTGELYRKTWQDAEYDIEGESEPLCMVRVFDSTPQPDGTRRVYWLRVPPWVRTAREAVAWTFGLPVEEYRPDRET